MTPGSQKDSQGEWGQEAALVKHLPCSSYDLSSNSAGGAPGGPLKHTQLDTQPISELPVSRMMPCTCVHPIPTRTHHSQSRTNTHVCPQRWRAGWILPSSVCAHLMLNVLYEGAGERSQQLRTGILLRKTKLWFPALHLAAHPSIYI